MKKIKLLFLIFLTIYVLTENIAYGFSISLPLVSNPKESSSIISWQQMKVSEFVNLSPKEFSALTGKKLNFFQRLSFKATQAKMKRDLKKNADLKLSDYVKGDNTFTIDILWLILGFIAGLGVILGYLLHQEKYKITSAWIGLGLFILGYILFH